MFTREIYKETVRSIEDAKIEKLVKYLEEVVRISDLDGPCSSISYRFEHNLKTDEECYKFVGQQGKGFYDLPEIPLDISGETFLLNYTALIES